MQKNVAGQKWTVFAFDRTDNTPKTGDAANITANLRIDGGAANAIDDTNPTELEDGFYVFDITQVESNGDMILISPESTTSNIQVIGVPGVIYTTAPNSNVLGIESDGDLTKVNALNGHTAQTADHTAGIADIPTVSEFNARTLVAADYFDPATDVVANVTDVANQVSANVVAISGDSVAADNLESMYDGSGYTAETAPATQAQVGNLSTGSAAISTTVESTETTTPSPVGTPTNDYTATIQEDGTYHSWAPSAGTLEFAYNFNIGANASPVEVVWVGYVQSQNDAIGVYARNWVGASWEQIGTITGTASATDQTLTFNLTTSHVNTGANSGDVRIRFYSTGGPVVTTFATDRVLCSYTITNQSVGYANGAIWVDTNASNTNTVDYVDGVADNPVSTWTAALTLSASLGIKRFEIANGSSITLTGDSTNYTILGSNWTLALGGQIITNAVVEGAYVTGTATGSSYEFSKCTMNSATLDDGLILLCALTGTITFSAVGDYFFESCFSAIAGTATPAINFGALVGNTNVNFRHYSGGIELQNMGQTGTDTMSLEGWGQYVLNANCAGGTLAVRGHFKKTDNSGNITISDDANFKTNVIHFGVAQGSGIGSNQIQLASTASSTDGAYDPAVVFIVDGTGAGQTRLIYQYDGTSRTATVDRNWKVNPDSTSEYRVIAHPGREHVNEGLAQGGTVNTITLNVLASSSSDAYNNQAVFLRSGAGEDQVRIVTDYDGTTKVATVDRNWDVNPDSTTGYVMLPIPVFTLAQINAECDTALVDYDGPTNPEMEARTLPSANYFDPTSDPVANVTLVDTTTTNSDMRGTNGANQTVPDAAGTAAALHATTDGKINTAQADLDILTGADGTVLATSQPNYAPAKAGDAMTLTAAAVDAILDEVVEGTITLRQAQRALLSILTGKSNGGGTGTNNFRNVADSKNRVSATVDANGNRTAVTRDLT